MKDINDQSTKVHKGRGVAYHSKDCACRACDGSRKLAERLAKLTPEVRQQEEKRLAQNRDRMKRFRTRLREKRQKESTFVEAAANQAITTGKVNVTQAGEVAGISHNTAREMWREDRIRQEFRKTLHAKGITKEKIADTILAGLDANDIKVVAYEGQVTAREPVPNWLARHKFTETGISALELIEKQKDAGGNVAVFNLIAPVVQVPGHKPGCRCDKCEAVRQRTREELLARENYIPEEFRVKDVASSDDPFDKEKK